MTKRLRRLFPRLFGGQYRVTSPKTKKYNCIAWAAGDNTVWWEATRGAYWPEDVLGDGTVEAAIRLFENLGYTRTSDAGLEDGVAKVAVYGDEAGYTHAARQLPDGRWTSKIGKLQDIEHDTLDALAGTDYGQVVQILRRINEQATAASATLPGSSAPAQPATGP